MRQALKEWSVTAEALASGKQLFILRKGGIAEVKRGFELRHSRFLLFETWEHQQRELIQSDYHDLFDRLEPQNDDRVVIRYWAEAVDVLPAPDDRRALSSDLHIWTDAYIDKRYDYRPDLPLWLVTLRTHFVKGSHEMPNTRFYRGCRSWVELDHNIPLAGSIPGIPESRFGTAREELLKRLDLRP